MTVLNSPHYHKTVNSWRVVLWCRAAHPRSHNAVRSFTNSTPVISILSNLHCVICKSCKDIYKSIHIREIKVLWVSLLLNHIPSSPMAMPPKFKLVKHMFPRLSPPPLSTRLRIQILTKSHQCTHILFGLTSHYFYQYNIIASFPHTSIWIFSWTRVVVAGVVVVLWLLLDIEHRRQDLITPKPTLIEPAKCCQKSENEGRWWRRGWWRRRRWWCRS